MTIVYSYHKHLLPPQMSGSLDESVRLWDIRSGHCIRTIPAHADPVTEIDCTRYAHAPYTIPLHLIFYKRLTVLSVSQTNHGHACEVELTIIATARMATRQMACSIIDSSP